MKKLLVLLLMGILVSSPAFAKRESSSEDATSVLLYGKYNDTLVPIKVESDGSVTGGVAAGWTDAGTSVETTTTTDTVKIGGVRQIDYNLSDGLVAYYKMEDNASNSTVVDVMGVNNCTVVNSTNDYSSDLHAAGGVLGDYFDFTTADSEYLNCGSSATLKFTLDFAFAGWFKTTATNKDIAGNRNSSGSANGWSLEMVNSFQYLLLTVDTDGGTTTLTGTTAINDGNWKFIVAQVSGGNLQLYINGVRDGGTSTNATGTMVGDANKTYIGRSFNTVDYWGGDMDNVMLLNRALTQDEIYALYEDGLGTIETSGSAGATTNIIGSSSVVTSGHGLTSRQDLIIEGSLEVQGVGYFDGGIQSSGSIGCLMLTDTDSAGYSECTTLDGTMSCTVDVDGVCDGT